jgi:hypothetical protein
LLTPLPKAPCHRESKSKSKMTALETDPTFREKVIPNTPCERVRITNPSIKFLPELEPEEIVSTPTTRASKKVFGTLVGGAIATGAGVIFTITELNQNNQIQMPLLISTICAGLTSTSIFAYLRMHNIKIT